MHTLIRQAQPYIALAKRRRHYWLVPTILITTLALAYALVHKKEWEATQALVVRDEAAGAMKRPGQFETADSMKTAQETALELARSRHVVAAALVRVGRPAGRRSHTPWPTLKDVERTQKAVHIRAPRGAEFGKTEMFYLAVRDTDPHRAIALTRAIGDELDQRLRDLRDSKADSLVEELTNIARLAQSDLQAVTRELSAIERQVGSDLGELRILNEAGSGESNLRQTMIQTRTELRHARNQQRTHEQLLALLQDANQDPDRLLATPSELLESQPALKQLKDGLVASQLLTASLLGEMSAEHPRVRAATVAQQQIRESLHAEIETAIRGVEAQLDINAERIATIEQQMADVTDRMNQLAALRAEYGNLVAQVKQRSEVLQQADQNLAAARSSQAAAQSASLITRLDEPTTGSSALGPRKAIIVLAGLLGGLTCGLGIVVLAGSSNTEVNAETHPTNSSNGSATDRRAAPPAARLTPADRFRSATHGAYPLSLKQALKRLK